MWRSWNQTENGGAVRLAPELERELDVRQDGAGWLITRRPQVKIVKRKFPQVRRVVGDYGVTAASLAAPELLSTPLSTPLNEW